MRPTLLLTYQPVRHRPVVTDRVELVPEVPIEFAGAGAWEALVLASAICDQAPRRWPLSCSRSWALRLSRTVLSASSTAFVTRPLDNARTLPGVS